MTREVMLLVAGEIASTPRPCSPYVARTTRKRRICGRRYPLSQSAFYTALKQAFADENAAELRPHDLRHTAGNRTLAATGNLRLTQKLPGIKSKLPAMLRKLVPLL